MNLNNTHDYKYEAIRKWILDNIKNCVFKYGDKLPSENLLCSKFSISRQTVRNAMEGLEKEEIVKRVRGSGTYVIKRLGEVRNKTIGVLLSYINDYIFPQILQGIEETLTAKGFGIDLGMTYNRVEQERRFLERMLNSNISGLIVEGTKSALPNPNISMYEEFLKREIPIIFIHNYYPGLECPSVLMDDVTCAKKLTQILLNAGHKEIAGFFKFDDLQGQRRYAGYVKALSEAGIPINEEIIGWFSTNSQESLFKYHDYPILDNINKCTAIMCYNDQLASKMYTYFKKHGIKVPDDISMVGFDDSFSNPTTSIGLTTAKHPQSALGKEAAQRLMIMVEQGMNSISTEPMLMDATIVIRSSVRTLNTDNEEERDKG